MTEDAVWRRKTRAGLGGGSECMYTALALNRTLATSQKMCVQCSLQKNGKRRKFIYKTNMVLSS